MVLDQVTETIHGILVYTVCIPLIIHIERDGTSRQRSLGVVVIRGTQVSVVVPTEGMSEIENPFPSIE